MLTLDTYYRNIVDFIRRYRWRIPSRNDPRSLDMISDFALCMNGEIVPVVNLLRLDRAQEALMLANCYIEYVKEKNPELHEEANGTPEIQKAILEVIGE